MSLSHTAYTLSSPDKSLTLSITNTTTLHYSLRRNGQAVIHPSAINMTLAGGQLVAKQQVGEQERSKQVQSEQACGEQACGEQVWGEHGEVIGQTTGSTCEKVYPIAGNHRELTNHYNELSLQFKAGYSVIFRLYDEGMAYRFRGNRPAQDSLIVVSEKASFELCDNPSVILPETNNFTAWELSNVLYNSVSDIEELRYGITPTLFSNKKQDLRVVVAESDLNNYPGMYLRKENGSMKGYWAAYPKKVEMGSWGNFITVVKERESYLARTAGNHAFPWRVAIVADDDKDLLSNELIYLLAKPQQLTDTDWIRPGKATWEWWHCAMLENAPFQSGPQHLSTQLYKYYIDFASENQIEYLLVDAGWSSVFNHTEMNPNIDIKEIIRYGKQKSVGIWLWTVAATLIQHPHVYLDSISSWGAAGVKIDFFDRDDAQIMPEYENLAKACAERRLMVDFHGCSKPTGLHRAYPNILAYEAMRCAECFKWDTSSNPDYQLQCIFARMLAGGIDYTPGAMRNATLDKFKPIDPGLPSALGTRAHEMALFVVLSAPFASLSDSPDAYRKNPDVLRFLAQVPTSWDRTIPLTARVGEYAVLAKQKGDTWYVGGLNAWGKRKVTFDCSFLPAGKRYTMEIFQDKEGSNKMATVYERKVMEITAGKTFQMNMASGGGFVMVIQEK